VSHQGAPVIEGEICCTEKMNGLCTLEKLFCYLRVFARLQKKATSTSSSSPPSDIGARHVFLIELEP